MDLDKYKGVSELILKDQIDLTDSYYQSIILQRCAALYIAIGSIAYDDNPKKQLQLWRKSNVLLGIAKDLFADTRGKDKVDIDINNEVEKAHKVYVEVYTRSMDNHKILTGSIFSELFDQDSKLCKELTN